MIIDGVAGTPGSFGWVGHAFAQHNEAAIRTFAVAGDDGRCVDPTDDAIASGDYPLARSTSTSTSTSTAPPRTRP